MVVSSVIQKAHSERLLQITDLLRVEISVLATVGDGDGEEIIMCASV